MNAERGNAPFAWCLFHGRLGNNLFQYAAARALCPDGPIFLDFSKTGVALSRRTIEEYDFMRLCLPGILLPPLLNRTLHRLTGRHAYQWSPLRRIGDSNWTSAGTKGAGPFLLEGYFQFACVPESVPGDFRGTVLDRLSHVTGLHETTRGTVAVHVRRGDYLPHDSRAVCGKEYFSEAIERMRRLVRPQRFLVFSDDSAWCRENLRGADIRMADARFESDALAALHAMALCEHQIISNSTFSWWAGWLNPHIDKIVIGPDRWSTDGAEEISQKRFSGFHTLGSLPDRLPELPES